MELNSRGEAESTQEVDRWSPITDESRPVSSSLAYRSHAKVNLYLDVLTRRDDGYHDLETVFQTVDLFDELWFTERASEISLACSAQNIGPPEENLVFRAAVLLKEACPGEHGVHIELTKRIPVSAGLAGGSGNAAATLHALNRLWNLGLSDSRLHEFACDLGADVPYCLVGGCIAATGRGDMLSRIGPLPEAWLVMLHPALAISTAQVFNHLGLKRSESTPVDGKTPAFVRAIAAAKAGDWSGALFNRLEEVVFAEYAELVDHKDRLLRAGCSAAVMSGSGPTIFGLCDSREEARRVASTIQGIDITVARTVSVGVKEAG